ncbi:DUF883 family protein [Cupriavidus pinatubonensis]|uniref:DUF883 family protein n=1 Tax=Cupriavidus pinatubonensis TaxID=248026 RepID=UPI001127E29C|nr:DUF883 family protein [Cupriavidus pinatubonensis]QYY32742.1 DUF883 family protein [Cupriavidus pinatubonensis]TPQ42761.1 DUF883 domain-containing protein [Cupriavidus pinatubonensis]
MNDIRADLAVHRDALIRDTNVLLSDVQALLRDVADEAGTEASQAGTELGGRLRALQVRLDALREVGRDRVGQLAETADLYVREHPWQCIGTVAAIGAATGAIVALAVGRR